MLSQEFLQFIDIAARNGDGILTVSHHELHGARIRGYLFHLTEINHKGTMAADYHGIGLQRVFHLFHRGTEHIGLNLIISLTHPLDIGTYGVLMH